MRRAFVGTDRHLDLSLTAWNFSDEVLHWLLHGNSLSVSKDLLIPFLVSAAVTTVGLRVRNSLVPLPALPLLLPAALEALVGKAKRFCSVGRFLEPRTTTLNADAGAIKSDPYPALFARAPK